VNEDACEEGIMCDNKDVGNGRETGEKNDGAFVLVFEILGILGIGEAVIGCDFVKLGERALFESAIDGLIDG